MPIHVRSPHKSHNVQSFREFCEKNHGNLLIAVARLPGHKPTLLGQRQVLKDATLTSKSADAER